MSYAPYNKETASTQDRIAWALCQIIDDDAPMRWTRYRFAASCIALNKEVMKDLSELATQQEAQPQATGPLSFNCTNGCGACGVKLRDFVTHATQAQDGDDWVTIASEPEIVSTCCGSPVEVWDERKQDIVGQVRAAQAEPAGEDKEDAEPITFKQRLYELIEQHGSLRAVGRVLEFDAGYLSRLASGERSEPGDALLRRMGLREVTSYVRAARAAQQGTGGQS